MTVDQLTSRPVQPQTNRRPLAAMIVLTALGVLALAQAGNYPAAGAEAGPERLTSRPRPTPPAVKPIAAGEEVRTGAGQRRRVELPDGTVLYLNQNTTVQFEKAGRLRLRSGEVLVSTSARKQDDQPLVVKTPQREVAGRATRFAVRTDAKGTGVVVTRGQVTVSGVNDPVRAGQRLAPDAGKAIPSPDAVQMLDWTRELLAAETPLVPANQFAGGALVARDPDGQESRLVLRKHHIDVHIEDGFARTTIDQTYFNQDNRRLEGMFLVQVPADASLSRLAMYVDGNRMEGGMVERDYGRNVYEEIVYRQQDPALLEWQEGGLFKMRVFPLEPRQEKRILLSYTQKLPVQFGQMSYRFPASPGGDVIGDWVFHARIKGGANRPWACSSHELEPVTDGDDLRLFGRAQKVKADRDVVVTLADSNAAAQKDDVARFAATDHEGARYLMLRYRPSLAVSDERRAQNAEHRHFVFLFESSGDRDPLLARAQVEVIRALLAEAEPEDTFAVLAAGTRVRAFAKPQAATPENVQEAIAFLESAHLVGALDLGRALTEAAGLLKAGKNAYLVHVGSGIAALGERRTDALVKRIPEGVRYIGVGVGRRWARAFMKAAAERSGGSFTQINPDEPIGWRAFELAATLNAPRLLNVQVQDDAGRARFLNLTETIAQGEELCAVARLESSETKLPEALTITGTLDGKPFRRSVPVKDVAGRADYLPRTWAQLEINRLLAADAAKHKPRIIELSKAMVVMTPFTSLLVLESEEMYVQYKVDRGRKDHWAMYDCPQKIEVVYEPEDGQPADRRSAGKKAPLTAKQVLETVLARVPPRLLRWPGEQSAGSSPLPSVGLAGMVFTTEQLATNPFVSGLTPARFLLSDLNLPISLQSFSQPLPPFGGYPGSEVSPDARADYLNRLRSVMRARSLGVPGMELAFVNSLNEAESEAPPARVGQIVIAGNDFTRQSGRRLQGAPILSRIPQTPSLFLGSHLRLDDDATNPYRDVLTNVRETHTGSLMFGIGANSDAGLTGGVTLTNEWGRIWFIDQPGQLTPERVHGGIDGVRLRSLLYQRPSFSGDERLFSDLVAYCPGMNTSRADVLAVLETETAPGPRSKPGQIDDAARKLLDNARPGGWRTLTIPAEADRPAFTISFDGQGRYAWERRLPFGLLEQVVCDGKTLLHLYPDLGIGARRSVSRFHRLDFARLVPWVLPSPEDLARGADLRIIGERTVAVVPHGVETLKDKKGKPIPFARVQLVFADSGALAERQLVEMPAGKMLYREVISAEGIVRTLDKDGKELAVRKGALDAGTAPDLKPDVRNLVVLPLPYRKRTPALESVKVGKGYATLRFEDALTLFAAEFAAKNGSEALAIFKQSFHDRNQRQLGFYVLLAACDQNLDAEHVDVLAEHRTEPLAQYLALYSSPVLRKHASQWAVGTGQWAGGFLGHLAVSHALLQRWQSSTVRAPDFAQRQADLDRALDYVRRNKGTAFGWALLGLLQDRAGDKETDKEDALAIHRALAGAWRLFEDVPGLAYAARYEHARSLWKSGQHTEARKRFRELYDKTFAADRLPAIDGDFRLALLGDGQEPGGWSDLLHQTTARLIEKKRRPAVLALARQCWQLGDEPMANHLLAAALDGITETKQRQALTLAGVGFLIETGQLPQADQMLQKLLADPKLAERPELWRLAAQLAGKRDMTARELECLERALEAEYRHMPAVVNRAPIRRDYEKLLAHYQNLADAMVMLKLRPPADFVAKVVRATDRWRALANGSTATCQSAARILQTLGESDLAWDYLTTPIALDPGASTPWLSLAQSLSRKGELDLADRAFHAAFEAEPTNAQVLWDRAQGLLQAGKRAEAHSVLRQLAEGQWQPRYNWIQTQARRHVESR